MATLHPNRPTFEAHVETFEENTEQFEENRPAFEAHLEAFEAIRAAGAMHLEIYEVEFEAHAAAFDAKFPWTALDGDAATRRSSGAARFDAKVATLATFDTAYTDVGVYLSESDDDNGSTTGMDWASPMKPPPLASIRSVGSTTIVPCCLEIPNASTTFENSDRALAEALLTSSAMAKAVDAIADV
jgi:hypothetical protein